MMKAAATAALALAILVPGCSDEEGTTVGPRGGLVTSDDGRVTLDIPAGALADDVEIRIVEATDSPEDAVGPAYEIQPAGLTFSFPAELIYDLDGEMADVDPEAVTLVSERGSDWNALADHDVDMVNLEVSASMLYSATIGIIE